MVLIPSDTPSTLWGMANIDVIEFNGVRFGRYPDSPHPAARLYYAPGQVDRACGVESLHREVWKFHNGPIPGGHHVHHKDGNTLNNDISNLECMPAGAHLRDHVRTPEARQRAREHMNRIRESEAAKAWHQSPAGQAHHSRLGKAVWAKREKHERTCDQCGTTFESHSATARFCAPKCKAAWRRAVGADNEPRTCAVCGVEFACNRYSDQRCCGRSCGGKFRTLSPADRSG